MFGCAMKWLRAVQGLQHWALGVTWPAPQHLAAANC